ncbi:MAG: hypothetical protein FJ299_08115 [Planctomycetes bacterium]|nr:hypothetical protein [Planctomycetota bacterium]
MSTLSFAVASITALSTPQAPETALASLVPAEAFAVVRVASLEEFDRALDQLGQAVDEPMPFDAASLLSFVLGCPGPVERIDRKRPLCIAFALPEAGIEPALTFVLPVDDASGYLGKLPRTARKWSGERAAGYLALSELPSYAAPAVPSALVTNLPLGALAARVDIARLMQSFGPMLEMGMQEFRRELERETRADPLQREMAGGIADSAEDFMDALQRVDIAFTLAGSRADLGLDLVLDPHSTLAQSTSGGSFDAGLIRRLPEGGCVRMVADVDTQALAATYVDLFADRITDERITARMSAEERVQFEALRSTIGSIDALVPLLGRSSAFAYDFGENGLSGCGFMSSPDPVALVAGCNAWMDQISQALPKQASSQLVVSSSERSVAGIAFRESRLRFELAAPANGRKASRADSEMQGLLDLIYGKEGLLLSTGIAGQNVIFGANASAADLERACGLGSTGPDVGLDAGLDAQLARMNGADSGLWMQMDLGRVMQFATRMAVQALPGAQAPVASESLRFRLTGWGGARGEHWFGGLSCDLDELAAFVAGAKAMFEAPGLMSSAAR